MSEPLNDKETFCYIYNGEKYWVQFPEEIPMRVWEKVNRFVQSMKPETHPQPTEQETPA